MLTGCCFVDLPHPADIQFHSWGSTKLEAFGNMADCMFNYLANTGKVQIEPQYDFVFEVMDSKDPVSKSDFRFIGYWRRRQGSPLQILG